MAQMGNLAKGIQTFSGVKNLWPWKKFLKEFRTKANLLPYMQHAWVISV